MMPFRASGAAPDERGGLHLVVRLVLRCSHGRSLTRSTFGEGASPWPSLGDDRAPRPCRRLRQRDLLLELAGRDRRSSGPSASRPACRPAERRRSAAGTCRCAADSAEPLPPKLTLAELHDVLAVLRGDDRAQAVLVQQRRVVAAGQLEPLGVQNRQRTGRRTCCPAAALPARRSAGRLSSARRQNDRRLRCWIDAADGDVQRDRLRLREERVRLDLLHLGQIADGERPQVADAASVERRRIA